LSLERGKQFVQGGFGGGWAEQDAPCLQDTQGRWMGSCHQGARDLTQGLHIR